MKTSDLDLRHAQKLLQLVTGIGFVVYFCFTFLHLVVLHGSTKTAMLVVEGTSAAVVGAMWLSWQRKLPSSKYVWHWTALFLFIAQFNCLCQIYFTSELRQITNIALVLIISGYMLSDYWWFRIVILGELATGLLSFLFVQNLDGQIHFAITLLLATALAWVLHVARQRLIQNEKQLRIALDATQLGCFSWNEKTNEVNWDSKMHELFGLDPNSSISRREYFDSVVDADDLKRIASTVVSAKDLLASSEMLRFNFRILVGNKFEFIESCVMRVSGNQRDSSTFIGTCQNVTDRQRDIDDANRTHSRTMKQRASIAALAFDPSIGTGDSDAAYCAIAKSAALGLDAERVGIWIFTQDKRELYCVKMYESSKNAFLDGQILTTDHFPRYMAAIKQQATIVADDALTDPITSEFREQYLIPKGISSMMDSAVYIDGNIFGVVCVEHTGPKRSWHADEQAFASTMASFVVQVVLNSNRLKTENDHRFLLDHMHAAVVVHKPDTTIVTSNRLAGEWLGKSTNEIQGLSAQDETWDFVYEDGSAIPVEQYPVNVVANTLQPLEDVVFGIRNTNSVNWILLNAYPVFSDDGELRRIVVTFVDISLRKKIEGELRDRERIYRLLVENSPYCIHEIDLQGEIISMNKAGLAMLGIEAKFEQAAFNFFDIICFDDAGMVGDLFEKALQGEPSEFEFAGKTATHIHPALFLFSGATDALNL